MKKVITRFAPSPTGMLHIGNARTALINWIYARKYNGQFILRIDNTDLERSKDIYKDKIIEDLKWLGLNWDLVFEQSSRMEKYEAAKQHLIKMGRLYECYESLDELVFKRKMQLSSNTPPIYDRAALKLTEQQKEEFRAQGRKPHYRFLMEHKLIMWDDLVKGKIKYDGSKISDPIVIRENGSMTYMLCSTVDDIEYNISHIIRGEDHITNTAIQIQLFETLGSKFPEFGHLGLVKTSEDKISKRIGGFDIDSLRCSQDIEPMAIVSLLTLIGSSHALGVNKSLEQLIQKFDIRKFSASNVNYNVDDLLRLNQKLISTMDFEQIQCKLKNLKLNITREFWYAIRNNIKKCSDIKIWKEICYHPKLLENEDKHFLSIAAELLPKSKITLETWDEWIKLLVKETGRKGKDLFIPLRIALTGLSAGPELKYLLPLIGYEEVYNRLLNNNGSSKVKI